MAFQRKSARACTFLLLITRLSLPLVQVKFATEQLTAFVADPDRDVWVFDGLSQGQVTGRIARKVRASYAALAEAENHVANCAFFVCVCHVPRLPGGSRRGRIYGAVA